MGALQIVLGIVLFILVFLFIIWYAYHKRIVRNIDVPINSPQVELYCKTKFTDGYSSGTLIREKKNKNGTTLIEFAPDDVQQGEEVKMAEKQSIVVLNENITRLPQGDPSTRRQKILITSRNPLDFPKAMQGTLLSDFLKKEGQIAYIIERMGGMIESGDEAQASLMKKFARGEITSNVLGQMEEEIKKRQELKNLQEGKEGDKK